jgi:THO complex subunit 1
MMAKESGQTPARLCVLRSCNALLKRLSKSQDLTLCGQILIFIARIYSLGDKSGVNLHGAVSAIVCTQNLL